MRKIDIFYSVEEKVSKTMWVSDERYEQLKNHGDNNSFKDLEEECVSDNYIEGTFFVCGDEFYIQY